MIKTHRIWYVPDLNVWGTPGWGEIDLLMLENVDTVKSILFDSVNIGDNSQEIKFADLVDFRGNYLPATIENPKIIVKSKGEDIAFIVGEETNETFKIAHAVDITTSLKVDLFVYEMGK